MDDMPTTHPPIEKTATEARQGETRGIVRWVLLICNVAAFVALFIIYEVMY